MITDQPTLMTCHSHGPVTLTCPLCGQASDSIKSYTMMSFLLFILVGAWWRTKRVVACPSCMRKEIALSSLITLVPANILFPLVGIWHTVLFAMTFAQGHSSDVASRIR